MGLFDFLANAPAGSPASYQGMEGRRKIALQLLANSRKGYPKTIGEGLTAIGDAIGDRGVLNQLAAQEAAYQKQAAAIGAGLVPSEAQTPAATPGPQSEAAAPVKTAYAPESDTPQPVVTPTSTVAGYRPAPAYLRSALEQDVADPERRAYLGQLAGKEAQSADEVSPTGAAGPFQFTRGTGAQYGLMPDGQDMRSDIHGSIAAVQNLTDDNAATLTKMLGRPPSPGELALAHQQGAVTAGRMLTGAGNAPANNLAVNNVNPAASPQAAAAKIMGYYGMPNASANPRDAIAAAQLAQRQAGPQPNPTQAGPSAALPFSGSPTTSGLPPEITTGASAIRAAPPAPSQIQAAPPPVQVAQAAQPGVPPGLPTVRAPLTDLPQRPVPPSLTAPRPQDVPMTADEKRGWNAIAGARALGDPMLIQQAQDLINSGAAQRKQQYEVLLKDYQTRLEAPQRELERQKTELEIAKGKAFGGIDQAELFKPIAESAKKVEVIPMAQTAIRNARQAATEGNMFTGSSAEAQLSLKKIMSSAGFPTDPRIASTEEFRAFIKPILASARQALVGGANISDSDMKIAEAAVGGDIKLDRSSIVSILGSLERMNTAIAIGHQRKLEAVAGDDPQRQATLFGAYGLPMENIVPREAVTLLKSQPTPEVINQFNKKYRTPGLAQRILEGG